MRVPVANTLGQIGAGMSVILSNFNHERWMVCATSIAAQRLVVEECLKYNASWFLIKAVTDFSESGGQHNGSSLVNP